MKHLKAVLKYFLPMADDFGQRGELSGKPEGDKDEGGDPAPDPAGGDSGDPAPNPAPIGGSDPEGRPDWLPEKFWNPDLKAPRAEVMAKSFTELEGKFREKTDVLKEEIRAEMRASAPESYEVKLSEDLELPDNIELDLNIKMPGQAFVRGRGLESEWQGELAITGTTSTPIIKGSIDSKRGAFNLLGKVFNLETGYQFTPTYTVSKVFPKFFHIFTNRSQRSHTGYNNPSHNRKY